MAASSAVASRSFHPSYSGVFISFEHGEDSVERFVSHLSGGLRREGIPVSICNEREATGKSRIKEAINQARVSIVVLSLAYLASKRRMDELLMIIHQPETKKQSYFLVFYHTDPDDVEALKGEVGEAFNRLGKNFSDKKVKKWKQALAKAGGFGGEVVQPNQHEATAVARIVRDVSCYRSHLCLRNPKGLIEIDSRMQPVERLLLESGASANDDDDDDICGVGVWGMGGIGKFIIVNDVLRQIQGQFDGSCLIQGTSEEDMNRELSYLKDNLCEKVLIALVGVDKPEPVQRLLKQCDWIGRGSRIVVTTRDEDVIDIVVDRGIKVGGTRQMLWGKHKVDGFEYQEARRFLVSIAFGGNDPPDAYLEVLDKMIAYAHGNPSALKVLGDRLNGKSAADWESMLQKLDRIANSDIQGIMKRSFDLLAEELKDIFLAICLFEGDTVDYTMVMLEACYSIVLRNEIPYLVKKSLIDTDNNLIGIHSLHKAMGKEIVRKESSKDASLRRILWNHEDVHHVLSNSVGSGSIEGINLDICKTRELDLPYDAFAGMDSLKFLKFHVSSCSATCGDHCKVFASQGPPHLPSELRLLHWHKYPSATLSSEFNPQNLVDIQLVHSNLEWLWEGIKGLPRLKWIDLSHSRSLKGIPDFSEAPELESIILVGCVSFAQLHPSIRNLKKFIVINLKGCLKVQNSPILADLQSLGTVSIALPNS